MIRKSLVALVLARDGQCVIASPHCTGNPTVADHRVGRGMGGAKRLNEPQVLVAACWACNGFKESDVRVARDCLERGITLRRGRTVDDDLARCLRVPVTFPDGSRWLLMADGTRKAVK